MANRKRNIHVKFYVTAEEKEWMEQKMAQLQTKRIGAYEELVERCDAVAAASIRTRESLRDTEQQITA